MDAKNIDLTPKFSIVGQSILMLAAATQELGSLFRIIAKSSNKRKGFGKHKRHLKKPKKL